MRYRLLLSYRGTRYHGWQRQPALETYKGDPPPPGAGIPTIQETLDAAIAAVVAHPVSLVGSSRTDAGVHAKGQIAHFDTDQTQISPESLRRAANYRLPSDILIRSIEPAPDSFDAITAAVSKRYQYYVWNAPDRNPFAPDLSWHRWQTLDIAAMKSAAAHFVGEHDFTSFARPGHGRQTTIRTVAHCHVAARGSRLVIGIEGSGFLWNMVRIMVGTLVEVGLGRHAPDDIPRMLEARNREAAGPTAPPHGLYLQWINAPMMENPPNIHLAPGEFTGGQMG
jgi:tRNA pseudouridine38-40 synthase